MSQQAGTSNVRNDKGINHRGLGPASGRNQRWELGLRTPAPKSLRGTRRNLPFAVLSTRRLNHGDTEAQRKGPVLRDSVSPWLKTTGNKLCRVRVASAFSALSAVQAVLFVQAGAGRAGFTHRRFYRRRRVQYRSYRGVSERTSLVIRSISSSAIGLLCGSALATRPIRACTRSRQVTRSTSSAKAARSRGASLRIWSRMDSTCSALIQRILTAGPHVGKCGTGFPACLRPAGKPVPHRPTVGSPVRDDRK